MPRIIDGKLRAGVPNSQLDALLQRLLEEEAAASEFGEFLENDPTLGDAAAAPAQGGQLVPDDVVIPDRPPFDVDHPGAPTAVGRPAPAEDARRAPAAVDRPVPEEEQVRRVLGRRAAEEAPQQQIQAQPVVAAQPVAGGGEFVAQRQVSDPRGVMDVLARLAGPQATVGVSGGGSPSITLPAGFNLDALRQAVGGERQRIRGIEENDVRAGQTRDQLRRAGFPVGDFGPADPALGNPDVAEAVAAFAPLARAGVLDQRQLRSAVGRAAEDSFNDRRQLRKANGDIELLVRQFRNGRLDQAQFSRAMEGVRREYGESTLLRSPAFQEVAGIQDQIGQQRQLMMQEFAQSRGLEPRYVAWDEKTQQPTFNQQEFAVDKALADIRDIQMQPVLEAKKARLDELKQKSAERQAERDRRSDLFRELRELRNTSAGLFDGSTAEQMAINTPGYDQLNPFEQQRLKALAQQRLAPRIERLQQEEDYLQQQIFGERFGRRVVAPPENDFGPIQEPTEPVGRDAPQPGDDAPTFENGDQAEKAFAAGLIKPGQPFVINGVMFRFDENGKAERVR